MRLLIDEMYPPAIAEQLQRRGHDAQAVTACPELRALADADLLACAQQEMRAVVTENIADFGPLTDAYDRRGQAHHGLILVDPRRYLRGQPRTIGRMVTALDDLLGTYPDDSATSLRHWL